MFVAVFRLAIFRHPPLTFHSSFASLEIFRIGICAYIFDKVAIQQRYIGNEMRRENRMENLLSSSLSVCCFAAAFRPAKGMQRQHPPVVLLV